MSETPAGVPLRRWMGLRDPRIAATLGGTSALAFAAFTHANPKLDGLPHAPALSPLLGWPPALSLALGAAGCWRLSHRPDDLGGRRLVLAGGVLLLLASLFPQVSVGVLTLPVVASWSTGAGAGALTACLSLAGLALVVTAVRRAVLSPAALRSGAVVLLSILPAWHVLHLGDGAVPAFERALWTLAGSLTVAWAADRVAGGEAKLEHAGEWAAVVLLSVVYWLLKQQGLGYSASDEGIYFYAAKAWADGLWPYRDFFFSHPPVQLVAPMILDKLFGFSYLANKLMAPMAGFGAGLVLWRTARRHFGSIAGLATLGLFWFCAEVLKSTTTFTGAETATLFLSLGVMDALDRRMLRSGVWFGLASGSAIYASAGFLVFVLAALSAPRDPAKRPGALLLLGGFALTFGGIHLLFLEIGGRHFIDGVYRYHLLKPITESNQRSFLDGPGAILHNAWAFLSSRDLSVFLTFQAPQVWLAVMAPFLGAKLWPPKKWWLSGEGRVPILILGTLGALLMLAQLNERYDYYFMIVFPTLVPLAGFTIGQLVRRFDALLHPSKHAAWVWPAVGLAAASLWLPFNAWANIRAYPQELRRLGEVVSFPWTPAPFLPRAGEAVHSLFWSDTRVRGDLESGMQNYLNAKKRSFATAPAIADYIRRHTTAQDTITGGSDYAPILALLAGRRLAGNQIDTNSKVFQTGIVSTQAFWTSVCRDRPAYIVSAEMSYFNRQNLPNLPVVTRDFEQERTFGDAGLRFNRVVPITLFRRDQEPPLASCTPD